MCLKFNNFNPAREKARKIMASLKETMIKLVRCGMKITDCYIFKKVQTEPFCREGSAEFLNAVKKNDIKTAEQMVNRDRFIVYAVDHVKKTAAHYAAKKGYLEMLHMLKDRCADFHCVDDNHKSAFYYAVRNNNSSCVMVIFFKFLIKKFLIGEKSNPFQITTIEIKAMRIGRKVQNLVMEAKKVCLFLI